MTPKRRVLGFVVGSMLVVGGLAGSFAVQAANAGQETGPVYPIEGAWYGMTDFPGRPSTPTFDTFTSDARRPGVEGSYLCTIPAGLAGSQTPSAHGNWIRIATNTYAYTAMRAITSGTTVVGWSKFWGTITAVSENELRGTINAQVYDPDLMPVSPQFTGTIARHRIEIIFEQ